MILSILSKLDLAINLIWDCELSHLSDSAGALGCSRLLVFGFDLHVIFRGFCDLVRIVVGRITLEFSISYFVNLVCSLTLRCGLLLSQQALFNVEREVHVPPVRRYRALSIFINFFRENASTFRDFETLHFDAGLKLACRVQILITAILP